MEYKSNLFTKILGFGSSIILSLTGCGVDTYRGVYEGHSVEYNICTNVNASKSGYLYIYSNEKNGGYVLFSDEENDKRFDEIYLRGINKGDLIERYVNLETGQKILEQLNIPKEDK